MSTKRRDNKNRVLRKGETQRPDGRYMYRYKDSTGKDIDIKHKVIQVNHQLHYYSEKGKYVYKVGNPKTESGNRKIPLSNKAISILQEMKQSSYFNSIGSNINIDGYTNFVFLNSQKNNVIIPRQFSDSLTSACKKYNKEELKVAEKESREPELLPMVTAHILRHTFATRKSEQGMDAKVLQKIMGHRNIETTLNIYDHADLHRITKEFERVEAVETA